MSQDSTTVNVGQLSVSSSSTDPTTTGHVDLPILETKFEKFPELPAELQLKIIRDCIATASTSKSMRVVKIMYFDDYSRTLDNLGWPYKTSDHRHTVGGFSKLHQVNHQFQVEAYKKWSVSIKRPNGASYARFDPEETIVYVSSAVTNLGHPPQMITSSEMLTQEVCEKIRHLAVDFAMWDCFRILNPIQKFANLSDFTFVIHEPSCKPCHGHPERQATNSALVSVSKDDLQLSQFPYLRFALCLDLGELGLLCCKYQAKHPEYKIPTFKLAILYRDGKPCCRTVESLRII